MNDGFSTVDTLELDRLMNSPESTVMDSFVNTLPPSQARSYMGTDEQTTDPSVDDGFELVAPEDMPMLPGIKGQMKEMMDFNFKDFMPEEEIDFSVDQAKGVDDFSFRWSVGMGDTTDEKQMIAKKFAGNDGIEVFDGKLAVNAKGMKKLGMEDNRPDNMQGVPILIDELGASWNDIADESDDMGQSVALMGNFLLTRGAGPLALLLRSVSAGGIAFGSKQLQEKYETAKGYQLQSQDEIDSDAWFDAGVNAIAEPLFSFGDFGARKALGPETTVGKTGLRDIGKGGSLLGRPELKSKIDPERLAMIDTAREYNLDPSITQATDGKLLSRPQQIAERVFNSNTKRNNRNVKGFEALTEIETAGFGGKSLELNENQMLKVLAKDAEGAIESAQRSVVSAKNHVDQKLKQSIDDVINERGFVGDPGNTVKETLDISMNNFREASKELYAKVDRLAGKKQIVSTKNLREKWEGIKELLPMGKDGNPIQTESVKELFNIMEKIGTPRQTFAGMQDMRVLLGKLSYSPELKGTNGERIAGLLKEALDQDFNSIVLGGGPKAVKAMREATDFYANNIGQFDNVLVAKLTRDINVKGSVSNNQVIDTIIDSQNVEAIDNVRKLVGKDQWDFVRHEKLVRMGRDSIDGETGEMLGSHFLKSIKQLDPKGGDKVFKAFFGKDAKEIRRLATELNAVNGSIEPTGTFAKLVKQTTEGTMGETVERLEAGEVKEALKKALKAVDERDALMQNKFLKALDEGGDLQPAFFDHLLKKDGALQMRDVVRLVGEGSERHIQMQKLGFKRLMQLAIKEGDDTLGQTLGGKALYNKIKEARPALEQLYGKKYTKKLEQLGALSAFLSSEKRFSGGLIAASIAVRPLKNLGRIVKLSVLEKLMSTDMFMNWATRGLMKNPALRTGSQAVARAVGSQGFNIIQQALTSIPQDISIGMDSMSMSDASNIDLSNLDEQALQNMGTQQIPRR